MKTEQDTTSKAGRASGVSSRLIVVFLSLLALGLLMLSVGQGLRSMTTRSAVASPEAQPNLAELREVGYFSVTDPRYGNCVGDGQTDCTAAIQNAMDDAYHWRDRDSPDRGLVYFPPGTYRISDTLKGVELAYQSRVHAHLLVGSTNGDRPVLLFAPRPGDNRFNDPANPQPAIFIYTCNGPAGDSGSTLCSPSYPSQQRRTSAGRLSLQMASGLRNLDIRIAPERTAGTIALRFSGSQSNILQNVRIEFQGSGYAGIYGMIGTDSVVTGVEIVGGDYGWLGRDIKWPSMSDITLIDQRLAALSGGTTTGPITISGFRIVKNTPPAVITDRAVPSQNTHSAGAFALSDGSIEFRQDNGQAAIDNTKVRQVTLQNVYFKGAANLVNNGSGNSLQSTDADKWARVPIYGTSVATVGYQLIEGVLQTASYGEPLEYSNSVPNWLLATHRLDPQDYPTADVILGWVKSGRNDVVDVRREGITPLRTQKDALLTGAPDYAPILNDIFSRPQVRYVFLPPGFYPVGDTLRLGPQTHLLGTASHLTTIITHQQWSPPSLDNWNVETDIVPVIQTPDDADATTRLSFVKIRFHSEVNRARFTSIDWRSGRNSVFLNNQVMAIPQNCAKDADGHCLLQYPRAEMVIRGNGGGRFYGLGPYFGGPEKWHPAFRGLLILNTHEPLTIYGLDPEDAHGEWQVEVRGSRNIAVRGMKCEDYRSLIFRDGTDNILLLGVGGCGEVFLSEVPNVLGLNFAARGVDIGKVLLSEDFGGTQNVFYSTQAVGVLKRGSVDLDVWRRGN